MAARRRKQKASGLLRLWPLVAQAWNQHYQSLLCGLSLQLLGLALNISLERGQVARAFVGRRLCAVVEHLPHS